ncbi:hypothetical protein B0J17DRAFT_663375 [Rhizoctonia solani]|nr:hypothetical protein B0J17DRAFT_663375 [Rhizoctonia solani]
MLPLPRVSSTQRSVHVMSGSRGCLGPWRPVHVRKCGMPTPAGERPSYPKKRCLGPLAH